MTKNPKFTKAQQAKIAQVLDAYKLVAEADMSDAGYSNDFGCGNCGDMGPMYTTLHNLKVAFGIEKADE